VQPAIGEHLEQDRVPSRSPGHPDPAKGLALGQMQDARAIHEHGWARATGPEPTEIHLGDVGDEVNLDAARLTHGAREPGEELVVRE